MNEDNNTVHTAPATAPQADTAPPVTTPAEKKSGWMPLAAIVLAVAAWITLARATGYAAMAVAAAAIIVGAFGCRRRAGAWRNVAITAIIAAAVLIVVVLAFIIVLNIGLAKS